MYTSIVMRHCRCLLVSMYANSWAQAPFTQASDHRIDYIAYNTSLESGRDVVNIRISNYYVFGLITDISLIL